MRKNILAFVLCSFILLELTAAKKKTEMPFRVATFNIRLQTSADTAAHSWEKRKTDVARIIKQYDFDIFGVQEIGNTQQEADLKVLIPTYTYFGKGRDNQQGTDGEQIGILFKTIRYELAEKGAFFLSDTPDTISKGWDGDYRRMCVWTKLYEIKTKKSFYVFCTHFDHVGLKARAESAKLIVKKIRTIAGNLPVLLLGDLNATPNELEMYATLTEDLSDTFEITEVNNSYNTGTFNGYEMSEKAMSSFKRIDYVFSKKIKVLNYKVLTNKYSAGSYPSDHFPVMIQCKHL